MTLSHEAKEAIKTALAMTIAYGVGLQMGWERPYWAGFAVAFISLSTVGQSLNKGALRMTGTAVGAIVALTLIALFAQQRWLFILFSSLWFALCAYMNAGSRYQYFWFVAGFVSMIICIDGGPDPANAFAIAMVRLQQTGLGILVYSLVSILLWPNDSRGAFEQAVLTLVDRQQKLLQASLALLHGVGDRDEVQSLRAEENAGITNLGALLDAAVSDSDEIREMAHQWRDYQLMVAELAESMERWRENFSELQSLSLSQLLPGLDTFDTELQERFAGITGMLQGTAPQHSCREINLDPDATALGALSNFHRAALLLAQRHMLEIDTLSSKLFDTISTIGGFVEAPQAGRQQAQKKIPFTPDPDRLLVAGKMMLLIWLAFLAVFYIGDFPGGLGFVSMCGPLGLVLLSAPQIPVKTLYGPVALSILFGGCLYVFVMPQLASFTGLGLVIFASTFAICYRYATPQLGLNRAIGLALLVVLMSVSNQQSYNFLSVANTALMFVLVFVLIGVIAYIPRSPFPERVMLRLLKRYFRSAEFLLAQEVLASRTALSSRRESFHLKELASLPAKLQTWARHANPAVLGATSVQQLPTLTGRLQALSYRLQALHEARQLPQSPQLVATLADDMLDWRQKIIEALQRLAIDPADREFLQRDRLHRRLARLEDCIAAAINGTDAETLSDADREHMYELLGAYRGASEALLGFAGAAASIEWQPWYEERFA